MRLLVITIGILAVSAQAWGQALEVRVASVSGRVSVSGNARASSFVRRGDLLTPGDVIDTHGGGRLRIEVSDGSVVIVQPETRLVLQDYHAAGSLRELLKVFVGRVRIKINHFGSQPNPYRINSPSASIAVRGTEFNVAVGTGGETEIVVYEGQVEVYSFTDPQRRVLVEPGRGVIVRPNEPILFITPGPDNEIGDREGRNVREGGSEQDSVGIGRENESLRSAAGIYERYIDSIVDNGESVLPSRFAAFPDSHLDSLENPAYATEFSSAEGRLFLLPSLGGTREKEGNTPFGFKDPLPIDYSFSPQASFFKPFKKYHSVLGGSLVYSRNGFQSFSLDENVSLPSPPFPPATTGSRANAGSTTNSFFTASLSAARRFGSDGRTSVGLGVDFLSQSGSLLNERTQSGGGLRHLARVESRSKVQRTRLTIGLTRDIGSSSKLGIFYRYSYTSANDRNRSRTLDGVSLPLEVTGATGNSSELGVRLRGPLTRRLFYGAEGTLFLGRSDEGIRRAAVVDSNERSNVKRGTLGFGLGYALNPRTVLSLDLAGGIARARDLRREDLTGTLLEEEHQTSRFLSLNAAVQADVWRRLFVSGSILSVSQSRITDLQLFPDRFGRQLAIDSLLAPNGRSRDSFTDYFSNFGAGWRFKPNFLVEYVFSTDFGQTSPRHSLLLRYNFNPGGQ